jgi:hypothetical protein
VRGVEQCATGEGDAGSGGRGRFQKFPAGGHGGVLRVDKVALVIKIRQRVFCELWHVLWRGGL